MVKKISIPDNNLENVLKQRFNKKEVDDIDIKETNTNLDISIENNDKVIKNNINSNVNEFSTISVRFTNEELQKFDQQIIELSELTNKRIKKTIVIRELLNILYTDENIKNRLVNRLI